MKATPLNYFAALILVTSPIAHAALVVTYAELSDDTNTRLQGTSVLDFNSFPTGTKTSGYQWNDGTATVGSIDNVYVIPYDLWGGAPNGSSGLSPYAVQSASLGGGSRTPVTTLTLTESRAYFGFWWSAGDATNKLSFYSGTELIAEFTTYSLLTKVASTPEYLGNPFIYNEQNKQAYAFINVFGQGGTTWDRIIFSNQGESGFESDNWTVRTGAWGTLPEEVGQPLPGTKIVEVTGTTVTVIPEPSALLSILPALGLLLRRKRQKNA